LTHTLYIGEICAYVNTAGRVVSSNKMAIHKAGRVYSHFEFDFGWGSAPDSGL